MAFVTVGIAENLFWPKMGVLLGKIGGGVNPNELVLPFGVC